MSFTPTRPKAEREIHVSKSGEHWALLSLHVDEAGGEDDSNAPHAPDQQQILDAVVLSIWCKRKHSVHVEASVHTETSK